MQELMKWNEVNIHNVERLTVQLEPTVIYFTIFRQARSVDFFRECLQLKKEIACVARVPVRAERNIGPRVGLSFSHSGRAENGVRAKWSKEGCDQIQRVHAIKRDETLKPSEATTNLLSRVPLVITYNPALRSISSIIQRHFKIPSSSPRCNSVFQTTPLT